MIRRDPTACFEQAPSGCIPFAQGFGESARVIQLRVGRYTWGAITRKQYDGIVAAQKTRAVVVGTLPEKGRTYWMFQGQFYWEDEGYKPDEVKALILDRQDRKERRVSSAIAKVEMRDDPSLHAREAIPDDVKLLVWQRDGGKCVQCGSQSNLEYDHVIPVAKGGSNTARNIQLLCESCNRAKGANLV